MIIVPLHPWSVHEVVLRDSHSRDLPLTPKRRYDSHILRPDPSPKDLNLGPVNEVSKPRHPLLDGTPESKEWVSNP